MSKLNKGFTILELVIVLIIVTILVSLGIFQYSRVYEKTRADEARQSLWEIRVAWGQYTMNNRDPYIQFEDLKLSQDLFPKSCQGQGVVKQYFQYDINRTHAIATRCTNVGSKKPRGRQAYEINIDLENSTWGGTFGY